MLAIPAVVKIFCVFGLILILNRARLTLSVCMLTGAMVLAFWMQMPAFTLAKSLFANIFQLQTISLVLIVGTILVISRIMKDSGHLKRIVDCFSKLMNDDKASGSVMAALIGLLPMPGGALFSAPMVDTAFQERTISGEAKTAVNYWFRHIWEYWWPLYPGVVLAVALLDVPTWRFMAFMAPMTIVTVFAGFLFILKPLGTSPSQNPTEPLDRIGLWSFVWEIMPILVIIAVIVLQSLLIWILRFVGVDISLSGAVSILPGLTAALIWVCRVNHIPRKEFQVAVLDKSILPLIFLVVAIMIFKGVLTDSHAVSQIRDELVAYQIPALFIIMIMPFLCGLITGIAIGFVGVSFPLIIPLFPTNDMPLFFAYAMLAYSFGYMGMMLSPVHLCLLVTKDYYKASLMKCYRYLILPAIAVMMGSVLIFAVIAA